MQRLIISTSTYPLHPNDGLPRFVHDLAGTLNRHARVTVLAPAAPDTWGASTMDNVQVQRFRYWWPARAQGLAYGHGIRDNMRRRPLAKLQVPSFMAAQTWATMKLLKTLQPDAVNSHWLVPQGLSTALAKQLSGHKFRHVLSVHAGDVYLLQRLSMGGALARFVLRHTDAVFADGSHVRDSLLRLSKLNTPITLQPMGVHTETWATAPGATPEAAKHWPEGYLLFFGRLTEKKGVHYLLHAMLQLRERHPGLGLVVAGYGSLEPQLRAEAQQLGMPERVWFAGSQPHERIASWLSHARLAVVPSVIDSYGETDGMPTVVLEAMAAGVPVVGCAVDGIPDIIEHGKNGFLCREKDPTDLAEKIEHALSNMTEIHRKAARETADQHDWTSVAQRYLNA